MTPEKKINSLINKTKQKLKENDINLSVILVDFADEYRKIWEELE